MCQSIFGAGLFDLNAEKARDIVAPHWWIFFVVALVTTILVLGVWLLWELIEKRPHKGRAKMVKGMKAM